MAIATQTDIPQTTPQLLAQQCKQAIDEVAFPDLKTRQLFEALIKNIAEQ